MSHSLPIRRVAIVSGAFDPAYSYQENIWAEVLARRGLDVTVYTAGATRDTSSGAAGTPPYRIESFPFVGSDNRHLYWTRGLAASVAHHRPELVLWFGPPQLFGRDLVDCADLDQVPIVTFMGQNRRMQPFEWWGRGLSVRQRAKAVAYRLLRVPTIAAACRRAQIIVTNTAETAEIVLGFLPRGERAMVGAKIAPTPLGFDETVFAYSAERRQRARTDLGLEPDEIAVVASSRFATDKAETIRFNFAGLTAALAQVPRLSVWMVGASDNALSDEIRRAAIAFGPRVRVEGFAGRESLSDLFHAADIAVFSRPSISCQEALGAGAFGVFADDGSMTWLLDDPRQGRLFATGQVTALTDTLYGVCRDLDFGSEARAVRAGLAARLSYERIVDDVLARVGFHTASPD